MIFDCFTYFNEEEILKIRLHELNDVVDRFVIVEAETTFTGMSKPSNFSNIGRWIEPFMPKISYGFISMSQSKPSPWEREYFQRNKLIDYIDTSIYPEDKIFISDVDEIIRPETMVACTETCQIDVEQYMWNFNWKVPDHCNQGARPVCVLGKDVDLHSAQEWRSMSLPRVSNGGWHFSFFHDPSSKIQSFAHTEYDQDDFKDDNSIAYRIQNGIDPFDRFPLKWYDIDETYPRYVFENKELYSSTR